MRGGSFQSPSFSPPRRQAAYLLTFLNPRTVQAYDISCTKSGEKNKKSTQLIEKILLNNLIHLCSNEMIESSKSKSSRASTFIIYEYDK